MGCKTSGKFEVACDGLADFPGHGINDELISGSNGGRKMVENASSLLKLSVSVVL